MARVLAHTIGVTILEPTRPPTTRSTKAREAPTPAGGVPTTDTARRADRPAQRPRPFGRVFYFHRVWTALLARQTGCARLIEVCHFSFRHYGQIMSRFKTPQGD